MNSAGWQAIWQVSQTGLTLSGASSTIEFGSPSTLLYYPYFYGGNQTYGTINGYGTGYMVFYENNTFNTINVYKGGLLINSAVVTNINFYDSLSTALSMSSDTVTNINCNSTGDVSLSGSNVITNFTRTGTGNTLFNYQNTTPATASKIVTFNHTSTGTISFLDSAYVLTANISSNILTRRNIRFGVLNLLGGPSQSYTLASNKIMYIDSSLTISSGDCNGMINLNSDTVGRQSTIRMRSGTGNVSLNYANLRGVIMSGSGTYSASDVIDLGNNSGWSITTLTSHDYYWIGGTGNWNDGSHWSSTSGGSAVGCGPTLVDNVYFDANSFNATGQTVTLNVANPACNSMNWTGVLYNPTLAGSSQILNIYGSLTLVTGMTANLAKVNFEATSTGQTITMGSQIMTGDINFNGIGGGWTLQDSLKTDNASFVYLNNGSLNTNNQKVLVGRFISANNNTRSLTLGTSEITLLNGGGWQYIWYISGTGLTFSGASSTINMGRSTGYLSYPYFYGGSRTYGSINLYASGYTYVYDNNRITNLYVYSGQVIMSLVH